MDEIDSPINPSKLYVEDIGPIFSLLNAITWKHVLKCFPNPNIPTTLIFEIIVGFVLMNEIGLDLVPSLVSLI